MGDVRPNDTGFDIDARIGKRIQQTRLLAEAELRHHVGLGEVRVDQQHFKIALRRQRKREIDRAIGFAVIRPGRTDQHQARKLGIAFAHGSRGRQQLPLHQAKLLRQSPDCRPRHEQAAFRQQSTVDRGNASKATRCRDRLHRLWLHRRQIGERLRSDDGCRWRIDPAQGIGRACVRSEIIGRSGPLQQRRAGLAGGQVAHAANPR